MATKKVVRNDSAKRRPVHDVERANVEKKEAASETGAGTRPARFEDETTDDTADLPAGAQNHADALRTIRDRVQENHSFSCHDAVELIDAMIAATGEDVYLTEEEEPAEEPPTTGDENAASSETTDSEEKS